MELHDNISFEERAAMGLDEWTGTITVPFTAYAANESDVKAQFVQTIREMDPAVDLTDAMNEMEVDRED